MAHSSVGSHDIAVVGQALRLPGARTSDEFWANLAEGRSLISEVPEQRWRAADHAGDPRRDGDKTSSVWGGFITDAECFDADFFQVSPREARLMDPQQRMALELELARRRGRRPPRRPARPYRAPASSWACATGTTPS